MADAPASAAAATDNDATIAQALNAVMQLTEVYGFDVRVAEEAVNEVGVNVMTCANYIVERGLGQDSGGPVAPISTCPHVETHLRLTDSQIPLKPQETVCTYAETDGEASVPIGGLKSDEDEPCQAQENWLCLACGVTRCSRYIKGHALTHYEVTKKACSNNTGHCLVASCADLSVWCHSCQAYVLPQAYPDLADLMKLLEERKFREEGPVPKKARSDDGREISAENPGNNSDDQNGIPSGAEQSSEQKSDSDKVHSDDGGESSDESPDSDSQADGGITLVLGDNDDEDAQEAYLTRLLRAAASGGIDIEWMLQEAQEQMEGPPDYPFDALPNNLEQVADFIQSNKCQKILILAGAGMSVSAGIPDFRSADGLYATLDPEQLSASPAERQMMRLDPSSSLDQSLFLENPLPMLELQREFILGTHQKRWKATLAHRFVELLHSKTGKLARLYTQNIDGLEDQTSLPTDKVIGVHGSMDRAECARCNSTADFDTFCESVASQIKDLSGRDPKAPSESSAIECQTCGYEALKPAIVLFKSSLPRIFFESVPDDVEDVDLLFVMGTSLRVAPANSLVWRVPRSALRVLVNREPAGSHLGMRGPDDEPVRDFHAAGDCDDVFIELMTHLGWLQELKPLLQDELLPPVSAAKLQTALDRLQP